MVQQTGKDIADHAQMRAMALILLLEVDQISRGRLEALREQARDDQGGFGIVELLLVATAVAVLTVFAYTRMEKRQDAARHPDPAEGRERRSVHHRRRLRIRPTPVHGVRGGRVVEHSHRAVRRMPRCNMNVF